MTYTIIFLSLLFFATLATSIKVIRDPKLIKARFQTVLATLLIATLDILVLLAYFLRALV